MSTHFKILPFVQPNSEKKPINVKMIKKLCAVGLSECPNEDRAIAWLILLGVYPKVANDWYYDHEKITDEYMNLVKDVCHMDGYEKLKIPEQISKEYFNVEDKSILSLIHSDIIRTRRVICFFPIDVSETPKENPENTLELWSEHMRRLERLLYIFGKLNGSLSYMQGFNELASVFYYLFLSSKSLFGNNLDEIEALSLRCLQQLLTGTRLSELYSTHNNLSILRYRLKDFNYIFQKHLPKIAELFTKFEIDPLQYCYKWFNILFAQEYDLPTLLIVWDSFFAHFDDLITFLFYFGVAHIKALSDEFDDKDPSIILMALHSKRERNVYPTLKDANEMYLADKKELNGDNNLLTRVINIFQGFK